MHTRPKPYVVNMKRKDLLWLLLPFSLINVSNSARVKCHFLKKREIPIRTGCLWRYLAIYRKSQEVVRSWSAESGTVRTTATAVSYIPSCRGHGKWYVPDLQWRCHVPGYPWTRLFLVVALPGMPQGALESFRNFSNLMHCCRLASPTCCQLQTMNNQPAYK